MKPKIARNYISKSCIIYCLQSCSRVEQDRMTSSLKSDELTVQVSTNESQASPESVDTVKSKDASLVDPRPIGINHEVFEVVSEPAESHTDKHDPQSLESHQALDEPKSTYDELHIEKCGAKKEHEETPTQHGQMTSSGAAFDTIDQDDTINQDDTIDQNDTIDQDAVKTSDTKVFKAVDYAATFKLADELNKLIHAFEIMEANRKEKESLDSDEELSTPAEDTNSKEPETSAQDNLLNVKSCKLKYTLTPKNTPEMFSETSSLYSDSGETCGENPQTTENAENSKSCIKDEDKQSNSNKLEFDEQCSKVSKCSDPLISQEKNVQDDDSKEPQALIGKLPTGKIDPDDKTDIHEAANSCKQSVETTDEERADSNIHDKTIEKESSAAPLVNEEESRNEEEIEFSKPNPVKNLNLLLKLQKNMAVLQIQLSNLQDSIRSTNTVVQELMDNAFGSM